MFPKVPAPKYGKVKIPVDAKLKSDWRYDLNRRIFVSKSGETFRPRGDLPKRSKIVYKVPSLAHVDPAKLSEPEKDLQRYLQVILPFGKTAKDYVNTVRSWKCIAEAEVGPKISLP